MSTTIQAQREWIGSQVVDIAYHLHRSLGPGLLEKVYVTGCLSERYKGDLESEIPGVDAWFGTMELPNILKAFAKSGA